MALGPFGALLLLAGQRQALAQDQSNLHDAARRGAALIRSYGCGSCHIVPGIENADGLVGPPLTAMGQRIYIAGILRNTPENMIRWLRNPQRVVPGNAMPNMHISEQNARDITIYLDSLR